MPPFGVPMCVVGDTREAYGRICQALAGDPSRKLKTIGVTGTSGKTTVSCLIASVLQAAGIRVGLSGTLGACDGATIKGNEATTPHADVLARWMSDCLRAGCTHAVLETSSVALAQKRVAGHRMGRRLPDQRPPRAPRSARLAGELSQDQGPHFRPARDRRLRGAQRRRPDQRRFPGGAAASDADRRHENGMARYAPPRSSGFAANRRSCSRSAATPRRSARR